MATQLGFHGNLLLMLMPTIQRLHCTIAVDPFEGTLVTASSTKNMGCLGSSCT